MLALPFVSPAVSASTMLTERPPLLIEPGFRMDYGYQVFSNFTLALYVRAISNSNPDSMVKN